MKNEQDIYKLLEINPTDNFTVVKKAYIKKALETHPDKNPGKSDEEFKILQNAWEVINTEAKLQLYFKLHQENRVHEFAKNLNESFSKSSSSFAREQNQTNEIPSDALNIYRSGDIDMFIPVPFSPSNAPHFNSTRVYLSLDPTERDLNLENIRQYIMKANQGVYQIGVTYEEAVNIANQHSHHTMYLIARIRLPITRISDARASEVELTGPHVLNARSESKYFYLQPNTIINKEDIHTVQPMDYREYRNSIRFMHDLEKAGSYITDIWSKNPPAFYVKGQNQHSLEKVQNQEAQENEKVNHASKSITGLHIREHIRSGWNKLFFSTSSPSSSSEAKEQSERTHYFLNNK